MFVMASDPCINMLVRHFNSFLFRRSLLFYFQIPRKKCLTNILMQGSEAITNIRNLFFKKKVRGFPLAGLSICNVF